MITLPIEFEEKMRRLLGDEFDEYIKCYDAPRYYGLRVNTQKISVEDFLKICPFEVTPIPWIENGFYYDGEQISPAKHPYYYAGLYYLQEPSAMTPANRLPVEPGDKVLDVCAAPGGKATWCKAPQRRGSDCQRHQQFPCKGPFEELGSIRYWKYAGSKRRTGKVRKLFF